MAVWHGVESLRSGAMSAQVTRPGPTRVALDTGPLLGHRTGIGTTVALLLEGFATLDAPPDVRSYALSFRGDLPSGTTRLPLPAAAAHRLWGRMSHPRLDRWLGDAQVVHGTNHVVPPTRRPRLVSVYDTWFLTHPDGVHPDVARMAAVLRRSVHDGAVLHTSSHASADRLRDLFGPLRRDLRIEVVHLGTPPRPPAHDRPDRTTPDLPGDLAGRSWVLALGTRERRKNLPTLVEAYGRATASMGAVEREAVRLVVAGAPGNDDEAITAAVERLPADVRHHVLLLGSVTDARKTDLLSGAAVLAYPSLDEGFGLPLLEAMDLGVPVVASTAGSIPEVAGPAARLVPSDDVDGLAAALHAVLTDEAERLRLGRLGRERAAAFTWTETARRMADLYSALAAGS